MASSRRERVRPRTLKRSGSVSGAGAGMVKACSAEAKPAAWSKAEWARGPSREVGLPLWKEAGWCASDFLRFFVAVCALAEVEADAEYDVEAASVAASLSDVSRLGRAWSVMMQS